MQLFRPKTPAFCRVLREYFAQKAKGVKDSTIEKHLYFYNNIQRFFEETGQANIQIQDVKIKHMEQLRQWLYDQKKCTIGHASRHIEHCQAAFDYAVLMEYYTYNSIDAIKCQRDKTPDPVALDQFEIAKLHNAEFSSKTWKQVRDMFLFQCFTGLSFMDLWLYTIEKDGEVEWVTSPVGRGKNGKPYSAHFNEFAKPIHEAYNGKFPEITNRGYNRILKKIAFSVNISKDLSSHTGRKTYITLRWNQGVSMEGLCEETGDTPSVLNKHYLVKGRERIKREIESLKGVPLLARL